MTLDTLSDGTHVFTPGVSSGIDTYGIQRPSQATRIQGAIRPALQHVYPLRGSDGKPIPNHYGFEFTIDDLRGGIWKQERGPFSKTYSCLLSSSAEGRFEGYLSNPLSMASQDTLGPFTTLDYTLHWAFFADQVALALQSFDSGGQTYLFKENASTGVITRLTYAKGAGHTILGLARINFGTTSYLAVQKFGQPVEMLTDLASPPTAAGTMAAATAQCWWIVNTDLPDTAVVALCGTTIYAWPRSAAYGDAPTTQETNVAAGGFLVGLLSMNSSVNRIYYVRPPDKSAGFGLQPGSQQDLPTTFRGHLYSRNQRGQDEADVTWRWGLNNVTAAIPVRGGIVATDLYQAKWNNGLNNKPLRIIANAPANSDIQRVIVGFASPDGESLFIKMNEVASTGATIIYWLRYDWDTDSVARVSEDAGLGVTGLRSLQAGNGPGLPASPKTGNLISRTYSGTAGLWWTKYEPPSDQNPHQLRHTSGAAAGTGKAYAQTFRAKTPEFWLDGFEGADYWVGRITGPPVQQILDGGTGAFVTYTIGGKTATFRASDPLYKVPDALMGGHDNWVPLLQLQIDGSRAPSGTDATLYSINTLPVKVQGILRMPKGIELTANMLNGK